MKVRKKESEGRFGGEELVGMGLWFKTEGYRRMPDGRIHPDGRARWYKPPLEDPYLSDLLMNPAKRGCRNAGAK